MASVWTILEDAAGYQPIDVVSDTQLHSRGTKIRAKNETGALSAAPGICEFIYLKANAVIALGELCLYDSGVGYASLPTTAHRGTIAIAMNNMALNTYGWFQIYGKAVVKTGANTVVLYGQVYGTATPGTVDDAVVAGALVTGAIFITANGTPAAQQAFVSLNYPFMGGLG